MQIDFLAATAHREPSDQRVKTRVDLSRPFSMGKIVISRLRYISCAPRGQTLDQSLARVLPQSASPSLPQSPRLLLRAAVVPACTFSSVFSLHLQSPPAPSLAACCRRENRCSDETSATWPSPGGSPSAALAGRLRTGRCHHARQGQDVNTKAPQIRRSPRAPQLFSCCRLHRGNTGSSPSASLYVRVLACLRVCVC